MDQHNAEVYHQLSDYIDSIDSDGHQFLPNIEESFPEDLGGNMMNSSMYSISEAEQINEFDQCFSKLICFGLFCAENKKYIVDLINIYEATEGNILNSPVYPLLVEGIKLNAAKQNLQETMQMSQEPIAMRDISNLEDLQYAPDI